MVITRPVNATEIDELRWYLHYDTVNIFITNHRWHILVKGRCIYLNKKNVCDIYHKRSRRCRAHKATDCERHGDYHDVMLKTPEDLDKFLSLEKAKRARRIKKKVLGKNDVKEKANG
jgi:Fe-S-cluster containining protein